MLARIFVTGLHFGDALRRLSLLMPPQVKPVRRLTAGRRSRARVLQDVVYIAASLDEVHSTPPNDSSTSETSKEPGRQNQCRPRFLSHQIFFEKCLSAACERHYDYGMRISDCGLKREEGRRQEKAFLLLSAFCFAAYCLLFFLIRIPQFTCCTRASVWHILWRVQPTPCSVPEKNPLKA
jgi:hypothetical protein